MNYSGNRLYLHAAEQDGQEGMWYGNLRQGVRFYPDRKASLEQILAVAADHRFTFCILGTLENTPLIVALDAAKQQRRGRLWQLATGGRCAAYGGQHLPGVEQLFGRMDAMRYASSLGGWRPVRYGDLVAFRLAAWQLSVSQAARLAAGDSPTFCEEEPPERLLTLHPAWPALEFVGTCSMAASRLLAWLTHPSSHVNPNYAHSSAALEKWFGVKEVVGETRQRAAALLSSPAESITESVARREPVLPLEVLLTSWLGELVPLSRVIGSHCPSHFFRRNAARSGALNDALTGAREMLAFVVAVWRNNDYLLNGLTVPANKQSGGTTKEALSMAYKPRLFVPRYCFGDDAAAIGRFERCQQAWLDRAFLCKQADHIRATC